MELSEEELERYSRHFSVKDFGLEGQKQLKQASVLCVGAGGIGSPVLLYLAAAGVGHIGIIDFDQVELSNLQRQVLFNADDLGKNKAVIAKEKLLKLNSNLVCKTYSEGLTLENAKSIISNYDLVLDGSDNYPTRYLVNDVCCALNKPFISASIFQMSGQWGLFNDQGSACFRCLFPAPPEENIIPNCAEAGVLGILPGLVGNFAALDVIKFFVMKEYIQLNTLNTFDAKNLKLQSFVFEKSKTCSACVNKQIILENNKKEDPAMFENISVNELKAMMDKKEDFLLLDVRQDWERELAVINDSKHVLLDKISETNLEIDFNKKIVLYCKVGGRSAAAAEILIKRGWKHCYNLQGGIIAWAREIDPTMKTY